MFNIQLLQAISDWQRGGDAKQKEKRGKALKEAARCLPDKFRSTEVDCYRQIALEKNSVWNIGTQYKLSETISSWTSNLDVAKQFKGGVPPSGYQGVIFKITPTDNVDVIINLHELFACQDFADFLAENKNKVDNFSQGTGKYGNTQCEVVISTDSLELKALFAWGGYSSPEQTLATMFFGHEPTTQELELFRDLMMQAGHNCGPYWLTTPDAVERVSEKLRHEGERLKKIKEQQEDAKHNPTVPSTCVED